MKWVPSSSKCYKFVKKINLALVLFFWETNLIYFTTTTSKLSAYVVFKKVTLVLYMYTYLVTNLHVSENQVLKSVSLYYFCPNDEVKHTSVMCQTLKNETRGWKIWIWSKEVVALKLQSGYVLNWGVVKADALFSHSWTVCLLGLCLESVKQP